MSQYSVFESTVVIHLPVNRVWDLLTDWAATPLWMPGILAMHSDDLQLRVGTTLDFHVAGGQRRYEIHDLIEQRLLVVHTSEGADGLSYRFDLKNDAGFTEVVLQVAVIDPDLSVAQCEELAQSVRIAEGDMLERLQSYAEHAP